ncbi:MAG: murein biosynthesis integral membrane protein MurJ [Gemmatimonadetes bacterium]|nr:murein biosynthesis integral membrane protein MurJ [Gemmatimonadota bacterium]
MAAGIFLARVLGLIRERVFAFYFGAGHEADAYRAALKIPNVIRNLLGEGTLSASFIPVYAALLQQGEREAARQLASTIASLVVVVAVAGAFLGSLLAPVITDFVAPGFDQPARDLTATLVRIMFPMTGVMILSGWCLGVLNTHRRFFLSYAAPAVWNIAQIAALIGFGSWLAGWTGERLVIALAWGALVGSVLQVLVQLPATLKLVGAFRWSLSIGTAESRRVIRAWVPVMIGAGVWQISSVIDTQLGSLLGMGAVASLGYAQLIAVLPTSLFGISIAAAALPELSRDAAAASPEATRERLAVGARRVAFFVIPSAFALAALGIHAVGALYQTGSFDVTQSQVVAGVLAAYAIGLPAQSSVRLLTSGHYALGDTRTPVRIAMGTVILAAGLAFLLMRPFGAAGIALGSAIAAYLNLSLNYIFLERRTGAILQAPERKAIALTVVASLAAVAAGVLVEPLVATEHVILRAAATLGAFGVVYLAGVRSLKHPDALQLLG